MARGTPRRRRRSGDDISKLEVELARRRRLVERQTDLSERVTKLELIISPDQVDALSHMHARTGTPAKMLSIGGILDRLERRVVAIEYRRECERRRVSVVESAVWPDFSASLTQEQRSRMRTPISANTHDDALALVMRLVSQAEDQSTGDLSE